MANALLWAVPMFAQSDSTIHRDVEAVDVEAHTQKRQAMPTQTMSAIEIQQLGVQNLADAVRRFSGTNVKDYGGVGGLKTVSVRGLGAAHTAVSYDGVVVSDCQAGPIDVGRFSIGSIETIALTIGQPDGLLQPASAFAQAAMLSISTRKPNFIERQTDARAQLKGGSFGYFDAQVEAARKVRHSTLSGTAQFMRSRGDYRYAIPNVDSTESGRRRNSDIRSARAEINLSTADSGRFQNHLKAYGFYSERGLPGAVIFYYQQAKERLADKNFFVQNDCRLRLRDNLMFRFQAKYNYSWNRYEDTNVKYTGGRYVELNTQHEGYFSMAGLWSWRPVSVSLAGDVVYNTLESDIKDNPQPRRLTLLSALNVRAALQRFEATATLVARHASEKVEFGKRPDDLKRLTPAFSLKWSSNRATIRAMAKATYRIPTFNELYYTTLGTTGLKPEEARELNVGFDFGTSKFDFSADFYANNVENKIVAIPTLYVWKMANYGEVNILGVDVAAGTEFLLELGVGLRQFCDWAMLLHHYRNEIDHEAIRRHLKRLGLEKAYRACGCILTDELGLPAEAFTYRLTAADRRYARRILDVVFYRGNMGKYNKRGGFHGWRHQLESVGIKTAHFVKFYPLAPGFMRSWLWDVVATRFF